ncbi:GNAT family N-acetyltransferase [Oleomonas cavernae]|uniref:GNAT family N-acetyltransferase n=1 Tax=Oleomonas cavernae TaxID=2320859 RepID=A0A418WTT4_9PROT|nr:GNAT family N-acetyltransferase [Oleomonas cavernae]RJF94673.1 GNAT family N-acetyltransferase [Oleomonas cavernae]
MSDIIIRLATVDDVPAIHAMIVGIGAAQGEAHKITSTPDDIRRHGFGPRPAFEALIAQAGGRAVGLCLFFPSFSTWRGRPGAYVQDLFVDPGQRGTGLGRRLLARTAALVAARGGAYLRLSVQADNVAAQGFYARVGLHHSTAERIHQIDGAAFLALGAEEA